MPASEELIALHWDVTKLLELGVNEKWLMESKITEDVARDLVKGILYLREKYHHEWNTG